MNLSRSHSAKQEISLLLGFFIVTILFRFWTFFQSGLDWDESLYMLVSQSMLDGKIPYVEVWDNKPVGIYLLYLLSFSIFGKSVFAIRFLSCIAVAVTSYILYRIGLLFGKNGQLIGVIAGLIYIMAILKNEGTAANTEIFFVPFVAAAYYLSFANATRQTQPNPSAQRWRYLSIGLLLGIGFVIKYVVIYDLTAMLLLTVRLHRTSKSSRHLTALADLAVLLAGFLLPFLLMASFFFCTGQFAEFFYANFTANKIRNLDRAFSLRVAIGALIAQLRLNFPLWLCFGLTLTPLLKKSPPERRMVWLLLLWIIIPLAGIFLTFKVRLYAHYFLPILPPLSLVLAFALVQIFVKLQGQMPSLRQYLPLILAMMLLTGFYGASSFKQSAKFAYFSWVKGIPHYEDKAAETAAYLQTQITQDDYIYVADDDPVIYFLTDAKIPTRYAYPFFLIGDNLPKVAGVNPTQELAAVIAKQPLYVVMAVPSKEAAHNKSFYDELKAWLKRDYRLERSDDQVQLYRRKA